ncbi:hypothetical protein YC2023_099011 [Brassica napus]
METGSTLFESSNSAIHSGLIRMTKKYSYSQTGKLGSLYLKDDEKVFIFSNRESRITLFISSNSAIHSGLIRMKKKYSYSQTGNLGSPYL